MGRKNGYAIFGFFLAAVIILGSCVGGDRTERTFIVDPGDTTTPGVWVTDFIRDYGYAEGRIFDLAYPGEISRYDQVEVMIFEEETRADNLDAIEVYFQTGPPDPNGDYDASNVRMKDITGDYGWKRYYGLDTGRCPVILVFYDQKRFALGVIMEITRMNPDGGPTGVVDTIGYRGGGIDDDTVRVLQPLAKDRLPSNPAWSLMWRNCYRVPRNVAIDEFELKIFKGLAGNEGSYLHLDYQVVDGVAQDPYIKILGLDQWNNNSLDRKLPDGKIDPLIEVYRPEWGLVIFPHREPFNTDTTFVDANAQLSDSLVLKVPTLYDYLSTVEKMESSKYYLRIRVWHPDNPFIR